MFLYHGTSLATANGLATNPSLLDVTKGGGELGQGFYTTEHVAMAIAWARGRNRQGAVLEIAVDVSAYAILSVLTLNWVQVHSTWNQLKRLRQTRTYLFGYDDVYGPLATYAHATQHKFESAAAEAVLKMCSWRVV